MARRIFVICKSGRLHALVQALLSSVHQVIVGAISDVNNTKLVPPEYLYVGKTDDKEFIRRCVEEFKPDLVVIGPEEPLEVGVADLLQSLGVKCVGPLQALAVLETSKSFTRDLMRDYNIPGRPEHRVFRSMDGVESYLKGRSSYVIKPDGLTGGKGVMVSGDHLHSVSEAVEYCRQLFASKQPAVVIEEKLDGEEFSLQSFFDGEHIVHMVPVQDHKRAHNADRGPNTGGMGSYSCADHLLPFLKESELREAEEINRRVGEALVDKIGRPYQGILYGGFMLTRVGLKVIEYNARFGDPEIMNVLSILENDFLDVCDALVSGGLNKIDIRFLKKATVCKYVVPEAYPGKTNGSPVIDVSKLDRFAAEEPNVRVYYGAVAEKDGKLTLTGSRAIGIVGIGNSLEEAERIAEHATKLVDGPVYHRSDVGTAALIDKRVRHMEKIRHAGAPRLAKLAS